MANTNIYANQMAVISIANKNLNRHGNQIESALAYAGQGDGDSYGDNEAILMSFNSDVLPKGAIVSDITINVHAKITPVKTSGLNITGYGIRIQSLQGDFNQNTVTYNNRPFWETSIDTPEDNGLPPDYYQWLKRSISAYGAYKTTIKNILSHGCRTNALVKIYGPSYYYENYATLYAYSPSSENKPYITVNYSAPTIQLYPGITDGFFIAKNIAKNISWSIGYTANDMMIGIPAQTIAEVRCKSGSTTKTIKVSGSDTTATIPAGTFTEGSGQIKIAVLTTADGYAESEWINVNTTDQTGTAVAVSPRGVRIDGDKAQVFSWTYESPTGTPQTKAELQVSYDGGGRWKELTSAQGDVRQTTVPAGTLEAGAAAWRVRCFNSDGTPGEYSDGAYIIVAKNPSPPSYVTTNAKPRLTVEWASTGQQGYQVQVLRADKILFDSGTVFGLDKQLTLPDFLTDGSFTARVRIIDKQGLWSEWTKIDGSVQNVPAESISAATKKKPFGMTVEWSTDGEYQDFYLLRDGIPVGKATGREWTDWTANGKHKYTVRGVKNDGYYTDSDTVVGVTAVPYGAICLWDDFTHWMMLKLHEGGPFVHTENRSAGIEYVQYAGRALPVAYETGWKTVSHTVEYTVRKAAEWEALKAMEGQMVIYKDYRGARVIGMLESVDAEHTKRINFSLTIQETDLQERIAYD